MPPKTVTPDVMGRVLDAIHVISKDPDKKRTKREIERIAGLSHDAVARAFRQDLANAGQPWELNLRFDALVEATPGRKSETDAERSELERKLRDAREHSAELETALDAYAIALLAHHVATLDTDDTIDVIPIGRNRIRTRYK